MFGEAAFTRRNALEGIIVGLILNRSVSVDVPGEFSYVKACNRACPRLSCFFDFCLPSSLASIFLFYSSKLSQQMLCCNLNKAIAECDVFEKMCNHLSLSVL